MALQVCSLWAYLMGVYHMGVYLMGVCLKGVYLTAVCLMGVHFTAVYLTGMHFTGVCLMDMHLQACILQYKRAPYKYSSLIAGVIRSCLWVQFACRSCLPRDIPAMRCRRFMKSLSLWAWFKCDCANHWLNVDGGGALSTGPNGPGRG
jgi:hypothetical protein